MEIKMVTSIFSFSNNILYTIKDRNQNFSNILFVVYKCFEFGPSGNLLCGKELSSKKR